MNKEKLKNNKGFSLVEVLVAIGVFVLGVATLGYMVVDASVSVRQGIERTQAIMFSQEGIEAIRSIRDGGFGNIPEGIYGLEINAGNWTLSGNSDNQDQFARTVEVIDDGDNTKRIVSTVNWDFNQARNLEVQAVSYLTNWQDLTGESMSINEYCQSLDYGSGQCEKNKNKCSKNDGIYESGGDDFCSGKNNTACCFDVIENNLTNIDEYCQSLDYISGQCEKNKNKCSKNDGIYESGGDDFCSGKNNTACCF